MDKVPHVAMETYRLKGEEDSACGHRSPQPKGKVGAPAEYGDLILHQGLLAPKCFLGDALEGHKMSRAPFLGQHHLREGTSAAEPYGGRQEGGRCQ